MRKWLPGRGGWISCIVAISLALLFVSVWAVRSRVQRSALWRVVQSCVLDHELTGEAAPCLEVGAASGADGGFVVLQPPFGKADTILSPTRKVSGVEDPWLRSRDAPNYFEAAWNARRLLPTMGRAVPRAGFALGVNSPPLRSQDQLHIHIGCASPLTRALLTPSVSRLSADAWTRLTGSTPGVEAWALLIPQADLAGINVFRLAASVPDPEIDADRSTLVVAGVALADNRDGFAVLIPRLQRSAPWSLGRAETYVDSACRDL